MLCKPDFAIEKMRGAALYWKRLFQECVNALNDGNSLRDIFQLSEDFLKKNPLESPMRDTGFPDIISLSTENFISHCSRELYPLHYKIPATSWIRLDFALSYEGWCVDAARTLDKDNRGVWRILPHGPSIMAEALANCRAGIELREVITKLSSATRELGYQIIPYFTGHGIGRSMHEEPKIIPHPNHCPDLILQKGMTFALEFIAMKKPGPIQLLKNGYSYQTQAEEKYWSILHHEDTVVVHEDRCEILSNLLSL